MPLYFADKVNNFVDKVMMGVTQKQIARRLGLSSQAIRFALSSEVEQQRQIRPETRARILEMVKHLCYVPHRAGRRLARARAASHTTSFDQIGLMYLCAAGQYVDLQCLAIMRGAEHELSKLQASLLFVRVGEAGDWEKVQRLVQAGSVDGWLLVGAITDDAVNRLKAWRQPFVILGDHRCTQPVHSVNIDHLAVGRMAAQHLAALGHRRIGFIGGSLRFVYQQETLTGFKSAARELGLDEDERLFTRVVLLTKQGLNEVREWIPKLDPMPTAFVTPEPGTATLILGLLKELHLEVPRDVSLIAADEQTSDRLDMEYTRVELPITELGTRGAVLLHKIASKSRVTTRELRISPSLVHGWSSGAPAHTQEQ